MLSEAIDMNEKVLEMARELCVTSEYLFDIAVEMAEEELGIGLYD
jgi:hypothetical protein